MVFCDGSGVMRLDPHAADGIDPGSHGRLRLKTTFSFSAEPRESAFWEPGSDTRQAMRRHVVRNLTLGRRKT
jgi:hypothetical protein